MDIVDDNRRATNSESGHVCRDATAWKQRIYARERIPIYWIVNLVEQQVEVYTQPTGPGASPAYLSRVDFFSGDELPLVLDGKEVGRIAVAERMP